jgi:anionic cell wall polymer biosynthesis LytR-Cps2A-Psr (LCP) family protein
VDVTVARGFEDPGYDGFGFDSRGWSITEGEHHLDGANALAYARSRKAAGESDFTRAARQQQILAAMRDEAAQAGSLLFELPALLDATANTVRSDVPIDRLPELAAILDEVDRDAMVSAVIRHPLVRSVSTRFGASLEPDLSAIRTMAAALLDTGHAAHGLDAAEVAPQPSVTVTRCVWLSSANGTVAPDPPAVDRRASRQ